MSGLVKVSEVKKSLLSSKPLYLLYCIKYTFDTDHCNQLNLPLNVDYLL